MNEQMPNIQYLINQGEGPTFEDLAPEKLRHYFEQRAPRAVVNGSRSIRDLLEQAELPFMVHKGEQMVPTVAAVLLFGQRPTYYLPQAILSAARFPGVDIDLTAIDRGSYRGTVDQLVEQGVSFVARNMRTASIMNETDFPRRTDIPEYPLKAVREAITNAVMHRDYSITEQTITIAMFDDRLEIFNPGGLVRGMTPEDLGKGKHMARNPTLAEAMRQLGWVERFGTGIRLIQREMADLGSPEPRFTIQTDRFTITLYAKILDIWLHEGRRRYNLKQDDSQS